MKVEITSIGGKKLLREFADDNMLVKYIEANNEKIADIKILNEEELPQFQKAVDVVKPTTSKGWTTLPKKVLGSNETKKADSVLPDDGKKTFNTEFRYEPSEPTDKPKEEKDNTGVYLDGAKTEQPKENQEPAEKEKLKETLTEEDEDFEEYENCSWCGGKFSKSELRKEKDMGYLCNQCGKGIESREGDLDWEDIKESTKEGFKGEYADTDKEVEADAENKPSPKFVKQLEKNGKLKGDGTDVLEETPKKLNYQMDIDIWYRSTGAYGTPVNAEVYSDEEGSWKIFKNTLFCDPGSTNEELEQYILDRCEEEARKYVGNAPLKVNITRFYRGDKREEETFMINESKLPQDSYKAYNGEYDDLIGKTIRINYTRAEPGYTGVEGVVELIDSNGQLHGTWGEFVVQPESDSFEIIE
jgi:hypothetical protein